MTALTLTIARLAYLLLLWAFVLFAILLVRHDISGTRIHARRGAEAVERHGDPTAPPRVVQPVAAAPQRATRLVVTAGPLSGTAIPLAAAPVVIGRDPSCAIVLEDEYVSSRHARVVPDAGGWLLEDLGSTNGTRLDGRPVRGPVPLRAGQRVEIGRSTLELRD